MKSALDERIQQSAYEGEGHKALLNVIVAADFLREAAESVCSPFGISSNQFNVLRILRGAHPEGHPRCEISARMLVRAPDVTRLIDRLEQQGLVERAKAESDRRLSVTRVTSKGLSLLKRMDQPMREAHRKFEDKLGTKACKQLSKICESIYTG